MNAPLMVQTRRKRRNEDIFKVIKGLVGTIENLQEDLHGVLDDIKILLRQIDSVTEKIEEDYTSKEDKKSDLTDKERVLKPKYKLDDVRLDDVSPDLDLSYLTITPGNHMTKWGNSLLESPKFCARENRSTSISPLALTRNEHCAEFKVVRNDRVKVKVNPVKNQTDNVNPDGHRMFRRLSDAITEIEEKSPKHSVQNNTKTTCYAQFKTAKTTNIEPLLPQLPEPVERSNHVTDVASSSDGSVFRDDTENTQSDPSLSETLNIKDEDVYEKLMESQLEKMSANSDLSGCSEWSDNYMDFGTFSTSDISFTDETSVHYDKEVNPWTSYTLNHTTGSTRSSESFVSDTPSDILNDNTKSTSTLANMIFSDQLVRASNKQAFNRIVPL